MSPKAGSIAHMFELLSSVDDTADEAQLIEAISQLERVKAAATARQARLTAAFDAARRSAEASGRSGRAPWTRNRF